MSVSTLEPRYLNDESIQGGWELLTIYEENQKVYGIRTAEFPEGIKLVADARMYIDKYLPSDAKLVEVNIFQECPTMYDNCSYEIHLYKYQSDTFKKMMKNESEGNLKSSYGFENKKGEIMVRFTFNNIKDEKDGFILTLIEVQ